MKFINGTEIIFRGHYHEIKGLNYGWWNNIMTQGQKQALDNLKLAIMRCDCEKIHKEKLAKEIVKFIKEVYGE